MATLFVKMLRTLGHKNCFSLIVQLSNSLTIRNKVKGTVNHDSLLNKIHFDMKLVKISLILIFGFLIKNFSCKQNCGSAADGALNFMTLVGVSAQIIINVVNSVNDNNNNNNNNNNNVSLQ